RDPARWDGVLGVVTFDEPPSALNGTDVPVAEIRTPVLEGNSDICEIWRTARRVESGQRARVRYRRDENVLFGCIEVPEIDSPVDGNRTALHAATEEAYREIFSVLDAAGYGNLLRVWNYMPG